ncbi:MAG: hypothetical protein ACKOYM_08500 [Actinomycetes bacterium]
MAISATAVLALAYAMFTTISNDGRANRQQRLNLAVTTMVDTLKLKPWLPTACPPIATPFPSSDDPLLSSNTTPAGKYLARAVDRSNPENDAVVEWLDQGVVFKIVAMEYDSRSELAKDPYTNQLVKTPVRNGDSFNASCDAWSYSWPVARLTVQGCWRGTACDSDLGVVKSSVSIRGPKL